MKTFRHEWSPAKVSKTPGEFHRQCLICGLHHRRKCFIGNRFEDVYFKKSWGESATLLFEMPSCVADQRPKKLPKRQTTNSSQFCGYCRERKVQKCGDAICEHCRSRGITYRNICNVCKAQTPLIGRLEVLRQIEASNSEEL